MNIKDTEAPNTYAYDLQPLNTQIDEGGDLVVGQQLNNCAFLSVSIIKYWEYRFSLLTNLSQCGVMLELI
jgi:hypothetical protein